MTLKTSVNVKYSHFPQSDMTIIYKPLLFHRFLGKLPLKLGRLLHFCMHIRHVYHQYASDQLNMEFPIPKDVNYKLIMRKKWEKKTSFSRRTFDKNGVLQGKRKVTQSSWC